MEPQALFILEWGLWFPGKWNGVDGASGFGDISLMANLVATGSACSWQSLVTFLIQTRF